MTTAQIAREFGLTTKKLNKILPCIGKSVLHKEGIQYRAKSGAWFKYLNNRYAQAVPCTYTDSKGNVRTLNGLRKVVSSSITH